MKTIEIVTDGGIYGYYDNNDKCLYIGKTTRDFVQRNKEHKNSLCKSPFEKFYYNNQELKYKILFDCNICNLTIPQLNYLETCFIQTLKPEYNIIGKHKIENNNEEQEYSYKLDIKKESIFNFTKNEILVLNFIKNKNSITRADIKEEFKNIFSDRTLDRIMTKFKSNNILILTDIDAQGRQFYRINEVSVQNEPT